MSDRSELERLGVTLAQLAFTKWGWLFRDQPILDYGIDAHVEPKRDRVASGRPLALQIKTGQSYFTEPTDDGWVYRGKDKDRHLRYWLGHTLPVVIILCDDQTETLYWQHITTNRVRYTSEDWTIVIPRRQTINPDAIEALLWTIAHAAAGAAEDPLESTMPLLPPSAANAVRKVTASEPRGTLRLADALARGRHNPRLAVESILASRPSWLERGHGQFEAILGTYAFEHGHLDLAAQSFIRAAAQVEPARGRLYAFAAMFTAAAGNLAQASEVLQQADAIGGAPLLVAAIRLHLQWLNGDGQALIPEILQSATPQQLAAEPTCLLTLSEHARRHNNVKGAVRYDEEALAADPNSSGVQLRLAEALLWRVSMGNAVIPAEDLRRAEQLASAALEQRRQWAGPSAEALTVLLRKHVFFTGAYDTALSLATPGPEGQASDHETTDGDVAYIGAHAALALGQHERAVEFADRVVGTPMEAVLRALTADPALSQDEQIRLWQEALRVAEQPHLRIRGVYHLAALGAWPLPELDQLRQSGDIDPDTADILAARSEAARGNVRGAVMQLRRHTGRSPAAVEMLVEVLEEDQQYDQALQECARGIERFGDLVLAAMRLNLFVRGDRRDAAAEWAIQLLSRSDLSAEQKLILRRRLIGFYMWRADWPAVEDQSRAALSEHPGLTDLQWALIDAGYKQGRLDDAWDRLQLLNPAITHRGELNLWVGLHAYFGFTEADIVTALGCLTRWSEDPDVGAQILGTLLCAAGRHSPNGQRILPDLDTEGRERFQAALQEYTTRYPNGPIKVMSTEGLDFVEMLRTQLAPQAQQDQVIARLVRQGRLPLGVLAAARGRPYAQVLIQRACGPIVAITPNPARFDRELVAARGALNQRVVVDTSALTISTLLPGRWPTLRAAFGELIVPRNVVHDIQITGADLRRDTDSLSWIGFDPDQDILVHTQLSEQETAEFVQRIIDIETAARDLVVVDTPDRVVFPDRGGYGDREAWVSPVELAAQTGRPLWSDDLVVRDIAEQSGVPAFSTLAVLHALIEDDFTPDTLRDDVQTLARSYVVDLALTPDELLQMAREDEWRLGAASAQLQRASFWIDYRSGLEICFPIFERVYAHEPDFLIAWLIAACVGMSDHLADGGLHRAFALITDTLADHLAVDAPTRDVLHSATSAAADEFQRQRLRLLGDR